MEEISRCLPVKTLFIPRISACKTLQEVPYFHSCNLQLLELGAHEPRAQMIQSELDTEKIAIGTGDHRQDV